MNVASDPTGSLEVALSHTTTLLQTNPALAAAQATEILKVVPGHPVAQLLLGAAWRATGQTEHALELLTQLAQTQPRAALVHYELGLALAQADRRPAALKAMRRAVHLNPSLPDAWRTIGDELTRDGDLPGADAAYAEHIKASTQDPRLLGAAQALCERKIGHAELLLREHLKKHPTDVAALRMLAEVAGRLGRNKDAQTLLVRCLELAPSFDAARHNYALVLHRLNKAVAALAEIEQLLLKYPDNPGYRNLKAVILGKIGEIPESIEIYADVLAKNPEQAKIWMSYGHALATAGRIEDSIAAYRRCIALAPNFGDAYYSLANLKTFRFTQVEIQAMRDRLPGPELTPEDRVHFQFALGKALEDAGEYAASFEHYTSGNVLKRKMLPYEAADVSRLVRRSKALYSREFFAARAGHGAVPPDPIFVLGLPRAGSTLIEQILSSHPEVEGTMELHNVIEIAADLSDGKLLVEESAYPENLAGLSATACRDLGDRYLRETRIQRKTGRRYFIDKMPNNFLHAGFIHLMLPNAKIIDARRHPMACCFSGFKQHFAQGQRYTYSLEDIGQYYRDYVELMAHIDQVLPGRVHRVHYEALVENTEAEVRTLLQFCNLPFDAACLKFYETERSVRTASAQQVRQPIFRDGIDQWRHFEPWLAPLKATLGDVLDAYPTVVQF